MKNTLNLFCLLIISLLFACESSTDSAAASIPLIGQTEFKKLMQEENTVILDVRTPPEWENGMIAGAKGINVKADDFTSQIQQLDKDKTYLVYCKAGSRSTRACDIMAGQGFNKIYNLEGGYSNWKED